MATKAELRNQVLEYLGKKRIGQGVSNELKIDIEQAIDEVYAELKSESLATWSSTGAIPNDVLHSVKLLVALKRSSGLPVDRYTRLINDAGQDGYIAKRNIRAIVSPAYQSSEKPTDF